MQAAPDLTLGEAPPAAAPPPRGQARLRRIGGTLAGLLLLGLALFAIHHELRDVRPGEIRAAFAAIAPWQIAVATLLTLVSVCTAATYDVLALRYVETRAVRPRWAALTSAVAYAVSGAVGFGALSSSAVRIGFYARVRAEPGVSAVVLVVTGVVMALGAMLAAGLWLVLAGGGLARALDLPIWLPLPLGLLLAAVPLGAAGFVARRRRPLTVRRVVITPPGPVTPFAQLAISAFDWTMAAAVLWILLPNAVPYSLPEFAPLYVGAGWIGGLTGMPGGLGAFDALMLFLTPEGAEEGTLAALGTYRVIYYLLPLLLVGIGAAGLGRRRIARGARGVQARYGGAAMVLAPAIFAGLTFAVGVIVLWSLATPALPGEVARLTRVIPVAAVNGSHLAGAVTGVSLLLVAGALRRRSRRAWQVALALLVAGALFSALRGGGAMPSVLALLAALALGAAGSAFYRPSTPLRALAQPADLGWTAAALCAFGAFVWLGLIVFRAVPYDAELWLRFAGEGGGASRFLRAAAASGAVLAVAVLWRAVALARPEAPSPIIDEGKLVAALASSEVGQTDANLAWLGDKHLFWSPSGATFLQYAPRGGRLIVMGEPCGRAAEVVPLLRAFRDFADAAGAAPVFYSVGRALLPDLIDLGLVAQKVGEAAHVPLEGFSLEGRARKPLRQIASKAEREGLTFRIAPPEEVPDLVPRLKPVSDAWLAEHEGAEKSFSLGRFDARYLARFPVALVEGPDGVLAFGNVWTAGRRALSVDLMRHRPGGPRGVMDFLFISLAQWGRDQGFGVLDLGMAPLAGLEDERLDPLLSRAGAFAYARAERLYGFKGLRAYKEKFAPVWTPLYIAAPSRLVLPLALGDVTLLTSGGVRGLVR